MNALPKPLSVKWLLESGSSTLVSRISGALCLARLRQRTEVAAHTFPQVAAPPPVGRRA